MSTEQIAILVSFGSLMIAMLALGWNVYRDVVLKPKLRVHAAVVDVVSGGQNHGTYISVTGTDFGPGRLKVTMVCGRRNWLFTRWLGRKQYFLVVENRSNPLSTPLPADLEVGERAEILLPWDADCFLKDRVRRVGLNDSFGKIHWAPATDLRALKKKYHETFGPGASPRASAREEADR